MIGDHTQTALHELKCNYSLNPLWRVLSSQVRITLRSQEAFAVLKSWGVLDNVKGQTRVMISFSEKIFSFHENSVTLNKQILETTLSRV